MKSRKLINKSILSLAGLLVIAGCSGEKSKPAFEYMPDMSRSPALKAQEYDSDMPGNRAMLQPVEGTIPRGYEPYPYTLADSLEAAKVPNPLPPYPPVLEAGRKYFNNYCIVCHGALGDGRGYIVPKFPMPPSLTAGAALDLSDGRIFHIITTGKGSMPPYDRQLTPAQRWAIVNYVRALQRAANPTKQDIDDMKRLGLDFTDDLPDTASTVRWPEK